MQLSAPAVAIKRADFEGERYEMTEFQRRVRDNYELLCDETWVIVCRHHNIKNNSSPSQEQQP